MIWNLTIMILEVFTQPENIVYIIGDSVSDIQAAKQVSIKSSGKLTIYKSRIFFKTVDETYALSYARAAGDFVNPVPEAFLVIV